MGLITHVLMGATNFTCYVIFYVIAVANVVSVNES